ncbi:PadR family transcriptional regulator [Cohnella silvisoli]|uniref:PadR family transcriptional regulator n=1 Tax=Cohnella silvisoli TaxID=2873699 RepID=A0ABV1KL76_9BACL|nr:PadR family transcriptional regulator [Cohnella silvisoli]MCD9020796.1 PadR family transcriptional regulator [Cohnella silvisoli]
MNTLSYGLLSFLSRSSCSGYDLMLQIQPFWPAKHSQIYPLLAQLEKDEYVQYEHISQSDKPDKKVYSLTDKGIEALREWLSEPASDPVMRDDLYLKVFCMSLVDSNTARNLFINRLQHYQQKKLKFDNKLPQLQCMTGLPPDEIPSFDSPFFGAYLLLQKAISVNDANIKWCEWALEQIASPAAEKRDSVE